MNKTLNFHGYSDDIFTEDRVSNIEIDNCASMKPIQCKVTSGDDGLIVVGQYNLANNGCWAIAIAPLVEDKELPNWPMRFYAYGHSTFLEIDVPDNFELTFYDDGEMVEKYRDNKVDCIDCVKNDVCPKAKNNYGKYRQDCNCGSFVDKKNIG
jgi:hypothetical protein